MSIPYAFYELWRVTGFKVTSWFRYWQSSGKQSFGIGHDHWLLLAGFSGTVQCLAEHAQWTIRAGDLLLLKPTGRIVLHGRDADGACLLLPFLVLTFGSSKNPFDFLPVPALVHVDDRPAWQHVQECWQGLDARKKTVGERMLATAHLQQLLHDFLDAGFASQGLQFGSVDAPAWVFEAKSFIEQNFKDPDFDVQAIADRILYSRRHLQQKFREVFGFSPHEHVMACRIKIATQLLRANRNMTIDTLMRRCGFRSRSAFAVAFKKQLGVSPSEYRRTGIDGHSSPDAISDSVVIA